MFKNLVLAIVIILTMCVSSIANVSIVEYDKLNTVDTCVDMLDVCYTAYIIEYVSDYVIYTPVVYHTCNVVNNNTTNNTTMVASATTHSATVSNNNTTHAHATHATSVVDSIVYTHDATATDVVYATTIHTNSVVDNSIHTTSVVDTHTSIDTYTSAVCIATSACVVDAPIAEQYSIDYAYYTTYVPMCACVYASDACAYATANNATRIDKGAILLLLDCAICSSSYYATSMRAILLLLPWRSVYIMKCICTTHIVLDRHRLKTAIIKAVYRRPHVYKCAYYLFTQPKRMELFMR